eukprot:TRINITY_DN18391_c0_g1_i1.p1 TRINITY_DN18391_c0_g1~~TRINITY_DN18391_c0_g1_i1.p1  ORF type:complete len:141 (+),score=26.03 TRINITY_DN18391_c0_g1_i1:24-425(+)
MPRFLKTGKVVVILKGRFAGRKAVVVKTNDDATDGRPYASAIVAGIERYPKRVTRRMSKKQLTRRLKIKPFLKALNYNHFMPTRYVLDVDLTSISKKSLQKGKRQDAKKVVRKLFEEKHKTGKNKWFFSKLKF